MSLARPSVEICDPRKIICPRCGALQLRVNVPPGTHAYYCGVKRPLRAGTGVQERCGTYLLITANHLTATVTAMESGADSDRAVEQLRELYAAMEAKVTMRPPSES